MMFFLIFFTFEQTHLPLDVPKVSCKSIFQSLGQFVTIPLYSVHVEVLNGKMNVEGVCLTTIKLNVCHVLWWFQKSTIVHAQIMTKSEKAKYEINVMWFFHLSKFNRIPDSWIYIYVYVYDSSNCICITMNINNKYYIIVLSEGPYMYNQRVILEWVNHEVNKFAELGTAVMLWNTIHVRVAK